jgi:glycosyltransferase involved in cell wall biosynthesis
MRILVIQPTSDKRGHYGIWTVKLCQALAKKGHSVTLCTNKVYPEKYLKEEPAFEIFEVGEGRYRFDDYDECANTRPLYYFYGYFRNSYRIPIAGFALAKRKNFDVIFMADTEYMTASHVLRRYGKGIPPVILQINAPNFSYKAYPGSALKKIYKVIQRTVFKRVLGKEIKGAVVLGHWHEEKLREQLALGSDFPIVVIPDGGGDVPEGVVEKSAARDAIGLDPDVPIFLFFGMLRRDKGLEYLFEAVSLVKDEDFKLVIAGSLLDYTEDEIKKMISSRGIEDKVILRIKYIPDEEVHLYFYSSDVLVLPYPSIYSGGSGPLMKGACTHKRPVIVSNVSEMGRLVKEHKLGFVVEPENPQALAQAIKKFLATSAQERGKMAQKAFALAKSNSWEVMADKYTDIFKQAEQIVKGSRKSN